MSSNRKTDNNLYNRFITHKSGMKYMVTKHNCPSNNISSAVLACRVGSIHERNNEKGVS